MNKCLEHIIVDVLGKHENYERRNQNHDNNNRQEHFFSHFHLDTSSSRVKSLLLSFISSNERSLIMILYKTIQHAHFIFHVYFFGISMKRFFSYQIITKQQLPKLVKYASLIANDHHQ